MDLVWKESAGPEGQRKASTKCCWESNPRDPTQHKSTFKFTQGHPKRKRKSRDARSTWYQSVLDLRTDKRNNSGVVAITKPSRGTQPDSPSSVRSHNANSEEQASSCMDSVSWSPPAYCAQPRSPWSSAWHILAYMLDQPGNDEAEMLGLSTDGSELPCESAPSHDDASMASSADVGLTDADEGDDATTTLALEQEEWEFENDGSPPDVDEQLHLTLPVTYRDLSHKYDPIIAMCTYSLYDGPNKASHSPLLDDEEFCVVPLTRDCQANPFRVHTASLKQHPFLLHAILAISSHHLSKLNKCDITAMEMHNHRSTALHLFSQVLEQPNPLPLLDTILILVNLEVKLPEMFGEG